MSDKNNKNLLWHDTAIKLIRYAGKFRYNKDEFERQVAYLLLDVGVETLFRSFLTMPHPKAELSFNKRKEVAKGTVYKKDFSGEKFTSASFDELNFHQLVEAVKQVAVPKVNESGLEATEYYHNIRNKLYHSGEGIVPPKEKFESYLALADELLATLVNISDQPEDTSISGDYLLDVIHQIELNDATSNLLVNLQDFQLNIAAATEVFEPKYTRKSFERGLKEIQYKYSDNEEASVSIRYENQQERIKALIS